LQLQHTLEQALTTPAEYNAARLLAGELTIDHVTELVRYWQHGHGLDPDGKAGPLTVASLRPEVRLTVADGWLSGPGVNRIDAHSSWYGSERGSPGGIVAHFTDTDPGTAVNMAKRRQHVYGSDPDDRLASWHVTIDTDGSIVQMVAITRIAWHAGSSTAKPVPGLGWANQTTVGIELVGYGKEFPPAQVAAAKLVWRAIVQAYGIPRRFAMLQHSEIDPTRRDDPGPVWVGQYAQAVLDAAYAAT
jgi:hypothetical protein